MKKKETNRIYQTLIKCWIFVALMLKLAYKLWQLAVHCNENYSRKNQHNLWRQCTHYGHLHNIYVHWVRARSRSRSREPAYIVQFSRVNSIATTKHHDDNKACARSLTKRKAIVYIQRRCCYYYYYCESMCYC